MKKIATFHPFSSRRAASLLIALALLSPAAQADNQIEGQPPLAACKPGGFTVIGYPDEFGPKDDSQFDVFIDERFQGDFQTLQRIWLPTIVETIEKWNGISGSTWRFNPVAITDVDASAFDGDLTISACGGLFACPDGPPPTTPEGPGGGVIDIFKQTTLAVTLIVEDRSTRKGIRDSDVFFNPQAPFEVDPDDGEIDFATVLLHELGHTLGLDHNDNCSSGNTVMRSVVGLNERKRELFQPETEGVGFLYPASSDPAVRIFDLDETLSFAAVAGAVPPLDQIVPIYGLRLQRWVAATTTADGGDWLRVNPDSGNFTAADTIKVTANTSNLAPGLYEGSIAVSVLDHSGPAVNVAVELAVIAGSNGTLSPQMTRQGIVNGANLLSQRLAPGALVSLFGLNLAATTEHAAAFPLPTRLGGSEIVINGRSAPLLYVSPTQVNAIVPNEAAPGDGGVIARNAFGQDRGTPMRIEPVAPELFLDGSGRALAVNQDGSLNSPSNPAAPLSVVSIFFSGQGPVDPPVPSGHAASFNPLSEVTLPRTAIVAGKEARVFYMGLTPGFAGLAQANVEMPAGLTGDLPAKLVIGGVESNVALVTVQ